MHFRLKEREVKKISLTKMFVSLGAVALFLLGGVWFLTKSNAESTLAGKVNGEGISRKEFAARVERVMRSYPDPKSETLARIKEEVLDEIIVEKFLLQCAAMAGFVAAPENEIVGEIENIKRMSGLTEPELENRLGVTMEQMKSEISDRWAISQFIENEVLKNKPEDRETFLQGWLADSLQKAKIEKFAGIGSSQTAGSSCCAPGGSCGAGKGQGPKIDVQKDAREKGLEYYIKKTGKDGAEARVTDFGCHMQVDIVEEGKVVMSLSYSAGAVEET